MAPDALFGLMFGIANLLQVLTLADQALLIRRAVAWVFLCSTHVFVHGGHDTHLLRGRQLEGLRVAGTITGGAFTVAGSATEAEGSGATRFRALTAAFTPAVLADSIAITNGTSCHDISCSRVGVSATDVAPTVGMAGFEPTTSSLFPQGDFDGQWCHKTLY